MVDTNPFQEKSMGLLIENSHGIFSKSNQFKVRPTEFMAKRSNISIITVRLVFLVKFSVGKLRWKGLFAIEVIELIELKVELLFTSEII